MKKTAKKTPDNLTEKKVGKPKKAAKADKEMEESESDDLEHETSPEVKSTKGKAQKKKPAREEEEEEDFDDAEMEDDDFYSADDEFDIEEDPDFEEFDLPKSAKGATGKKKTGPSKDEFDDDFRDLGFFSEDAYLDEEDDDDF